MSKSNREVLQSPVEQGADESIAWPVDVSGYGTNPTNLSLVVMDGEGNDVTSQVVVDGESIQVLNPITVLLPHVHSLTAGEQYRVTLRFTMDGNELSGYCVIVAKE